MLGKLNVNEIEEVLKNQLLGRIACHADSVTYIVPVSYAYDGKHVYVLSRNGMKIEIMRKNREICFEVEAIRDMGNWKTIVAWGTFEEIIDNVGRRNALQKLHTRHLPLVSSETTHLSMHWPFEPSDLNSIEGVVYRFELREKAGRFETLEGSDNMSNAYF